MSRAVATDAAERRGQPRRQARANAWITAPGYGSARCKLVDRSADGARIAAVLGLRLGDRVTLVEEGAAQRPAEVMWIEADVLGLRFLD